MSRPLTRWTSEEDQVVVEFLKENHNFKNLNSAFKALSEMPVLANNNRTIAAISYRYQKVLRQNSSIFVISGRNGGMKNTKYIPENVQPEYLPLEAVMLQMLNLSREDRNRIINFFENATN